MRDRFELRVNPDRSEQDLQVVSDGRFGDPELLRDRPAAMSFRQEAQDLALTRGQALDTSSTPKGVWRAST